MLIIPILGSVALIVVLVLLATASTSRATSWIKAQQTDLKVRRAMLNLGQDGFPEIHVAPTSSLSVTELTEARYSLALEVTAMAKDQFVATRGSAHLGELAALVSERVHRRNLFTRRVGASLVFIGLFGTLLGLQAAIFHLSMGGDLKNSNDIAMFVARNREVLAEFSVAFWSTLTGVTGTILLVAVEYRYKRKSEAMVDLFEVYFHVDVLPYLDKYYPVRASGAAGGAQVGDEALIAMSRSLPAAAAELVDVTRKASAAAEAASAAALNSQLATENLQRAFHALTTVPQLFSEHLSSVASAHERLVGAHHEWTRVAGLQTSQLTDSLMRQSGDIDRGLSLVASLAETTHAYARQVELLGAKLVSSFAALDAFGPKADSTLATLQHFEAMAENLAADVQTLQREIRQHGVPGYAPNSGNDQNLTGVSERLGELADLLRARPSPGYAAAVVHERVETQTQTIPSSLTETPSTAGAGIDALVLRAAVAEAVKPIELRLRDMAQSASDIRRTVAYLAGLAETSHHVKTVARKFPRWWRN